MFEYCMKVFSELKCIFTQTATFVTNQQHWQQAKYIN